MDVELALPVDTVDVEKERMADEDSVVAVV